MMRGCVDLAYGRQPTLVKCPPEHKTLERGVARRLPKCNER